MLVSPTTNNQIKVINTVDGSLSFVWAGSLLNHTVKFLLLMFLVGLTNLIPPATHSIKMVKCFQSSTIMVYRLAQRLALTLTSLVLSNQSHRAGMLNICRPSTSPLKWNYSGTRKQYTFTIAYIQFFDVLFYCLPLPPLILETNIIPTVTDWQC